MPQLARRPRLRVQAGGRGHPAEGAADVRRVPEVAVYLNISRSKVYGARSTSSLSVIYDSDYDVADLVSAVDVPVGVDDLGQGIAAVDDDPELPLPD